MSDLDPTYEYTLRFQPSSTVRVAGQRPRRIGILLNGLDGKANTVALRFLILEMNRVQRTFEYEFLPFDRDDFLAMLRSQGPLNRTDIKAQAAAFHQRYSAYLSGLNASYSLKEAPPDYFVVVCLTTFEDNYYTTRRDRVSVIALGNWERHMAPPSIVEFLLALIVREAVASVSPLLSGSVHLGTKGCLFDFTLQLDDVRFKVLNAFVCSHCADALSTNQLPDLAEEIQLVLSKKWLGLTSKAGTPAAIASKLGHDLFATKGLQPTLWEQTLKILREEGTKQILTVSGVVAGAALLAWFGIKGS
jgi:hypothetical protein